MRNSRRGSLSGYLWELVSKNLGTKIISVAIAMVLWGVVLGSRNVEVTKEIPLEILTSPDIVASNEIPDKIAFRLSGPKAFLRSILDRREEPIRVNLVGNKPTLVTYRFFSDNIRLPIGVKVLSINPISILVKLESLKRREIPVRVELQGNPPEGYRLVKVQVKPELVRIKGPESKVDGLSQIPTLPIDLSELKSSVEKDVALDLSRFGVQLDGELPRVQVEVAPQSATFRIKHVDIRVLSLYRSRIEEKSVSVFVKASSTDLTQIDRKEIYAVVDLSHRPKGKYVEPLKVVLPSSIELVKVVPERVHLTLY
ncbi:MAG: YbbR-like domain-containing protein [Bdellovibrionia bacterium]